MILAHLEKPESYQYLPKAFQKAIQFYLSCDMKNIATGRHEIDGDRLFMNVMAFETQSPITKLAEVHKEYIDIQFVISGEEKIYFGLENENNPIETAYDKKDDFFLVASIEDQSEVVVSDNMFSIYFPSEPHKPGCFVDVPKPLKKAVIKMHKSLLNQ